MDIKRAKQEIKNTISAYLAKDSMGDYKIPQMNQRPILLIGPPGIGKTQIMEQVAKECKVGLVAYTITHHTRQSAIGLPFIKEKVYGGKSYTVTEYTMSEIIASVYEKIEKTGNKEGILFLDEINCVSETLAPTMLQFLQCKMFGNQSVPQGWIIVTAGNPPEYNKSVRDFDVVTLDRIKKISVAASYPVWKEYAYLNQVHPAILSYLELRRENFFRIETSVDGKMFVTARGWEDLSRFIYVMEELGQTVDREVVSQYIQFPLIAKDFANYLDLYYKYKQDYGVEEILEGKYTTITLQKMRLAPFDERLSVVGLFNGKLGEYFYEGYLKERYIEKLYDCLVDWRENLKEKSLEEIKKEAEQAYEKDKKAEILSKEAQILARKVLNSLEKYCKKIVGITDKNKAYEKVKELFYAEDKDREDLVEKTGRALQNAFEFIEAAFGEQQEMVAFMTELNANYYAISFIKSNGSPLYYKHNKGLLFDKRQKEILNQMEDVEELLNSTL